MTEPQSLFSETELGLTPPNQSSGKDSAVGHSHDNAVPLAARMRPLSLEEFVGQQHLLAPGKLLRRAIEADRISSLLFYGPPGTGKTSLAEIISRVTKSRFERLSGVGSAVSDLRKAVATAAHRLSRAGQKTILFIDELHRFNKAQQDVLLPDVEKGTIRLIGATTHNPSFYVNAPLVSRSQIFQLKPLAVEDITTLLRRALQDEERGLGSYHAAMTDEASAFLSQACDGDARKALNALELGVMTTAANDQGSILVDLAVAQESIQQKAVVYDTDGDQHYDTISAFIKSMRGSDPDAALYWLAKMVVAGEDPRFIARRIVIFAAEDIGMADPNALVVSVAAHHAVDFIGWPEGELPLAEAVVYCSTAPKSNASAKGIWDAKKDIENGRTLEVPPALRDGHYQGAARLGHGTDYKYPHNYQGHIVDQEYLPESREYYQPTSQGFEATVQARLADWRSKIKNRKEPDNP